MTFRLLIEYDGSSFQGWQRQPGRPSVQQEIEQTVSKLAGYPVFVLGSSRTDSGVHARGQVAHFRLNEGNPIPPERWCQALNFHLPRTIRILKVEPVGEEFNSQKNVISKIYTYRILNSHVTSALDGRVLNYAKPLDWGAISAALVHLRGEHDFKCFQGAKSLVKTSVRTIYRFDLYREIPHAGLPSTLEVVEPGKTPSDAFGSVYSLRVEGSGFLKQMVRTIVGTLLEIGEGKRSPDSIGSLIESRDRRLAGRTAPAHALCLEAIYYEGEGHHVGL